MGRDRPARRRVRDDCCRCPTRPVGHPNSILQPDRGTGGRRRRVGGVRSVHRGTAPSGYRPSRPRHPAPARVFADADDIASVLRYWVARATARLAGSGRTRKAPQLITGLMASADGPMTDDMRPALGSAPRDPRKVATWRRHARTVAAYRDCYGITEDSPLGPMPESTVQKIDHVRARVAVEQGQAVTSLSASGSAPRAAADRDPEVRRCNRLSGGSLMSEPPRRAGEPCRRPCRGATCRIRGVELPAAT